VATVFLVHIPIEIGKKSQKRRKVKTFFKSVGVTVSGLFVGVGLGVPKYFQIVKNLQD